MQPSFWNRSMGLEIKEAEITSAPEKRVRHADVGFDPRDLPHGPVFAFFLVLAAVVLMVHVGLWGVFQYLGHPQFAGHATTNPIMTSKEQLREIGGDPALTFPKPSLQPDPIADLNKFRAREEEEMNSYGWVDPGAQKIHIPIERAIDAMSQSWPNQQNTDEGQELSTASPQTQKQPAGKPEQPGGSGHGR
jgi:hypothetical protein